MAQRVLIGTCLVVMLAITTFTGLTWQRMNQDQVLRIKAAADIFDANRRTEAAFAEAQATNQAMMKQLRAMSDAMSHPRTPDWNPVILKLTEETLDGPPDARVHLTLRRDGEPQDKEIRRNSDSAGIADFGSVHPGDYTFFIQKNFVGGQQWLSGQLYVKPGSEVHISIVCPKSPPECVSVRIKLRWPADLEKEQLVTYAPFVLVKRELQPGMAWALRKYVGEARHRWSSDGMARSFVAVRSVLSGPGTALTEIMNNKALLLWTVFKGNRGEEPPVVAKLGPGDWADILVEDLREVQDPSQGLKWEAGIYGLNELIVLRPKKSPDVESGRHRFDVLVATRAPRYDQPILLGSKPPEKEDFEIFKPELHGPRFGQSAYPLGFLRSTPTVDLSQDYWNKVQSAFEARRGEMNEWTIPLPDELSRAVREALK